MTDRLLLRVKGDRNQAAVAAAARGIQFAFLRERMGETWGRVDAQHVEAVRSWYNEPRPNEPWPPGTLLAWGDHRSAF